MSEKHALYRTNAKGVPFVGNCYKCGAVGVKLTDKQDCANPANLSSGESLELAIKGGIGNAGN